MPRTTRSSFQARLAASRMPAHMPWPEERWRLVRGVAGEQHATARATSVAMSPWNVYTAARSTSASSGPSSRRASTARARVPGSRPGPRPASSMNSKRKRGAGIGTSVVGRAGSHTCSVELRRRRDVGASSTRSTTSHGSSNWRSCISMPELLAHASIGRRRTRRRRRRVTTLPSASAHRHVVAVVGRLRRPRRPARVTAPSSTRCVAERALEVGLVEEHRRRPARRCVAVGRASTAAPAGRR